MNKLFGPMMSNDVLFTRIEAFGAISPFPFESHGPLCPDTIPTWHQPTVLYAHPTLGAIYPPSKHPAIILGI